MANQDDEPREYASPPCLMNEVDPAYFGYLDRSEQIALLNLLLECERAGARGVAEIADRCADPANRDALRAIAHDEARFCAMLTYHIKQLGGTPSTATGSFYEKLVALDSGERQLDLLDRGQSWVMDKLSVSLPKVNAGTLHADLSEMLKIHARNIALARDLSL